MSLADDLRHVAAYRDVLSMQFALEGAADEVTRLELDVAWMENIAAGRGDENERLRRKVAALEAAGDRVAEWLDTWGDPFAKADAAAWREARR